MLKPTLSTKFQTARFKAHQGRNPETGKYIIDGKSLEGRTAIYLVSVGSENFHFGSLPNSKKKMTGFRPESVLGLLNAEFVGGHVIIVVAGVLQRYNIEIQQHISKKEALEQATLAEKQWISECNQSIERLRLRDKLQCTFEIVSWESCIADPMFLEEKLSVDAQILDEDASRALTESSEEYAKRQQGIGNSSTSDAPPLESGVVDSCQQFLIEEKAVLQMLAKRFLSLEFIVYPSACTPTLQHTLSFINQSIKLDSSSSLKWLPVKFSTILIDPREILDVMMNPNAVKFQDTIMFQLPENLLDALVEKQRDAKFLELTIYHRTGYRNNNDARDLYKLIESMPRQRHALINLFRAVVEMDRGSFGYEPFHFSSRVPFFKSNPESLASNAPELHHGLNRPPLRPSFSA